MKLDLDPSGEFPRPASPYDTLDADLLMAEVLHITDRRTLASYIRQGLPTHRLPGKGGQHPGVRLFIRGEVLDWLKSRCITPAADSDTESAGAA